MTIENAEGRRGGDTFPAHWGPPPGRDHDEARAAWISRNVGEDAELKRRGLDPAEARTGRRQTLSGHAALAKVARLSRELVAVPAPAPKPITTGEKVDLAYLIALLKWYADPSSGPAPDLPRSRTMSGRAALAQVAKLKADTT